ncbi:MAG TPA: acyl-CoA dehydratase activase-related protein [Acetivibrio sp.]|uniref:acyl-CoA dehydratase activase-related protein n=1 Tax=Acetivibrio sp. TaxID=1872092 RepID=UPI002CCC38A9|nr:acyl-CoA dehydratase activase-related protein [Acetivibrio sp.]HOM03135.1 acyl-CoA dehydratase activase-related protein [Acetivibrio sp.]
MATVGIPKGLFYFEHHVLWENFFCNLGCNVEVSDDTNKEILDWGVKYCSNETCLPVKVFHGHVYSLKDRVDYIFIPRYTSVDKNEYTCPKFCGLPDMTLLNLKRQIKVLEIKINVDAKPEETFKSLREISKALKVRYPDVVEAFKAALETYDNSRRNTEIFEDQINSSIGKTVISLLGHPYMIYDSYLNMKLIDKLKARNITVFTPGDIDRETKRKKAYPFEGKIFWDVGFELLGSAFTFASSPAVRGIIYLTPFACGVDAFVLEFIERRLKEKYNIPLLKLTIDEHTGEAGFDTRIEAFLDMIG